MTHLFVDDAMIARKEAVVRRAHECRKLPQPVIAGLESWQDPTDDERVYLYGTVLPADSGEGLRMWYMRWRDRVLYAESDDGIHWRRPERNLLPIRLHSPSVIDDQADSDAGRRYKMLGDCRSPERRGYCVAHSADGLIWQYYPENPVLEGGDTCSLARDPASGDYFAFHKRYGIHNGQRRRLVYLSASPDMQHWSDYELVMAPDEVDDAQTEAEGGLFSQFYHMSVIPYGGMWLGFVTHFRYAGPPEEEGPEQSKYAGPIDVQLASSRDGRSWFRSEDRAPVIANGPHEYDAGCILGVGNGLTFAADEVRLYYTGVTTTHGGFMPEKKMTVGRAAWRLDGWVSLDAADTPGTVETIPVSADGQYLSINVDAGKGELRAEVLDSSGMPVHGNRLSDCRVIADDAIRQSVQWEERSFLPPGPVSIRFQFSNASLYSFSIEQERKGQRI